MSSPTFVAKFIDGQTARMTVFHDNVEGPLDVLRGVKLARMAYSSRTKATPPAIVEAHFESDGKKLKQYDATDLAALLKTTPVDLATNDAHPLSQAATLNSEK